jgi:soluble P-type ATPase
MLLLTIPGREHIKLTHIILDFNGTIAIDGRLIAGVADVINRLSDVLQFYIVTADTYGTAESELADVNCNIINLSQLEQYRDKLDVLLALGKLHTACIGNGFNDHRILKESVLGIALLQQEGLNIQALLSCDFVCHSILDALACLENPSRIKATLRA